LTTSTPRDRWSDNGQVAAALAQGVTTLVVGQDGSSWIGAAAATAAYLSSYFGPVNGPAPPGGCDLAGFNAQGLDDGWPFGFR
jgi:hypothetical protein